MTISKRTAPRVIGGKIQPKEHKKLRLMDGVDRILDKLIFAKRITEAKSVRNDCLFLPNEMGPMWMRVDNDHDLNFFPPEDVNSPELDWPLSVGAVWPMTDETTGLDTIQCNYWESVAAKKLRGKYRFVGQKNIAWYHGRFIENMKFLSVVEFGAWTFGRWRSAQRLRYDEAFMRSVPDAGMAPIARYVDAGEDDVGLRCALGQSVGLTYRYEWGAQFSIDNSPRVIVPTTPAGVKELFNDRNKPEDRDRRAAIRHWVRQHFRKKQGEDFAEVRRHLRGCTDFRWRGFDVKIIPSKWDVEKNLVGKAT